jgi:hypothetical protein
MIPALSENDDDSPPPLRPPAAAANSPASEPATRLSDIYERDVLNFVETQLGAGASEAAIVASLLPHDFSRPEAQRLVRELAAERGRGRVGRRKRRFEEEGDDAGYDGMLALIETQREAARKDMIFGAIWFLGGLFLTLLTITVSARGGILFWGAIGWGAVQFLRGAGNYGRSGQR